LHGRWVPGSLPAPAALLACLQVFELPVDDPFGEALEVGTQEVAHAFDVLYALDVDGERGENLEDAIEEDPAT